MCLTTSGQLCMYVTVLVKYPLKFGRNLSIPNLNQSNQDYEYVCMIQVALAVMSMERTADWAKERSL